MYVYTSKPSCTTLYAMDGDMLVRHISQITHQTLQQKMDIWVRQYTGSKYWVAKSWITWIWMTLGYIYGATGTQSIRIITNPTCGSYLFLVPRHMDWCVTYNTIAISQLTINSISTTEKARTTHPALYYLLAIQNCAKQVKPTHNPRFAELTI